MLKSIEGSLEERFIYHAPTEEQLKRLQTMREAALAYANVIMDNLPYCRERSLALTSIEESSMWANKGAVFSEEAPD